MVLISLFIPVQVQAEKGCGEAPRIPARQIGGSRRRQRPGQAEERALEEEGRAGDPLLLPVRVKRSHQEGLPAEQERRR